MQHDDPHLKKPAAQLTQVAQLFTQPSHSGLHCLQTPSMPTKPKGHGERHFPLCANPGEQVVQFCGTPSQVTHDGSHL